jgi:hypothetical protein
VRGVGFEVIKCESDYLWRWIWGKRLGDHLILRPVCQLGYKVLVAHVDRFQGRSPSKASLALQANLVESV